MLCYSQLVESGVNTLTQGERVRYIRKQKNVNLTLEKFGERIGLKKSSLSQIENNVNSLTDSNIKAICREFNVNEDWLRTGNGPMEIELTRSEKITDFAADLLKDEEDCYRFFEDICTINEIHAIAQRLQVAKLLSEKKTYTEIEDLTNASTATISRINKCLVYGADGYQRILKRMADSKR